MPLIRKKTSKRVQTHKRHRIKHKIAEGKRKKRKEAKKNPQWKSKKKKDPGIPSNLPFKDEIIAEITEQRRQAEEEKRKRKEDKINAKEAEASKPDANTTDVSAFAGSSKPQEEDAPLLLNPDLPNFRAVIDKSHIILSVLDARDPLSYRISHIEDLMSNKTDAKFAFVLNKIDLIPRESATSWLKYLRSFYPTFAFRSASAFLPKPQGNPKTNSLTKGKAKEREDDALGTGPLLEFFKTCATELQIESLRIAVIGITNVGKSAMVNSLLRKASVPVYEVSATTHAGGTTTTRACEFDMIPQGSQAGYTLIDTPGVSFEKDEQYTSDVKTRDILMRRRGRVDKVKDPLPLVDWIVSKANTQDLMLHYNLPAIAKGDTPAFLTGVARSLNLIRKGGVLDLDTAARPVLRDWNTGKLAVYTEPEVSKSTGQNEVAPALPDTDESILAKLRTRKELWKENGSVKLERGTVEERRIALDAEFTVEEVMGGRTDSRLVNVNDEEDDDDDDDEEEDKGYESDNNDDESENSEEEEEEDSPPVSRKRKAPITKSKDLKPSKKVAFTSDTADRNEKKAARKLHSQQVKQKQKAAKAKTSTQEKSGGKEKTTGMIEDKPNLKVKEKPKSTSKKPPPQGLNKSSSKAASSTADSNAYDFNQFFKMS